MRFKRIDLTGQTFGLLTVLRPDGRINGGGWKWLCLCQCGSEKSILSNNLRKGATRSCGCGIGRAANKRHTTHGMSRTPLYTRWRSMLDRCTNKNHRHYGNYGGRGITVCDRWLKFESFRDDMANTFSPYLELDRIDVNGPYRPDNCRWVNKHIQSRNKRNNVILDFAGRKMTMTDWGVLLGIKPNTIVTRLRRGWPVERSLTSGADTGVLIELLGKG